MKKQIITLILAIFLISFISAIDIYSGESKYKKGVVLK
jgi:hypothetical protein